MPFRREYLCRPQDEPIEMSQHQTRVHDEVIEEFVPTCRHCKKTEDEHAQDKCLFEATAWDPMSLSEWVEWRKKLWAELGGIGADFIRDKLKQAGFAQRMAMDLHVYGNATLEVDGNEPGKVKVLLLDPTKVVKEDEKK